MPPAARITDLHLCPMVTVLVPHVGGPLITGAFNVIIGKMPASRVTDKLICKGPPDMVLKGSPTVIISKMPAARMFDPTVHMGVIVTGFFPVIIGEFGMGVVVGPVAPLAASLRAAAQKGAPFAFDPMPAAASSGSAGGGGGGSAGALSSGPQRVVDMKPADFAQSPAAQQALFQQAKGVQQRQQSFAEDLLKQLGIDDGKVKSILKRETQEEFTAGVVSKALDRKGYDTVGEMPDIVRGRFDLASEEQVKQVAEALFNNPNRVEFVEPRDRAGVPNGYPRYHVILRDPETGILHEWQLGTAAVSRVYEAPPNAVPGIPVPPGLELKPGMHPNIHDIEYDIFKSIEEGGPEDKALAQELGIPELRKKIAQLSADAGKGGDATPDLDQRIAGLHAEAGAILQGLVNKKGPEYVQGFFH